MTLSGRDAFNFYMEGAKGNLGYRVIPMDVSQIAKGMENIYTYSHRTGPTSTVDVHFAIGKFKEI